MRTALILIALGVGGCAGPEPVLYPNAHLQTVGPQQAERDIEACVAIAETAGADGGTGAVGSVAGRTVEGGAVGAAAGAAGGAVVGSAGRGAAVGAASGAAGSFVRGLFRSSGPSGAHRTVVERCLRERGYDPVGWD